MTTGYQPGYDIPQYDFASDLVFGQRGEDIIKDFLTFVSKGDFEVKYDRWRNGKMVVEMEQNPRGQGWKPSGLAVTTAHLWVYLHAKDAVIIVSVPRLKKYLEINKKFLTYREFAPGSDNPTRGYILQSAHVNDMMNNEAYDGE